MKERTKGGETGTRLGNKEQTTTIGCPLIETVTIGQLNVERWTDSNSDVRRRILESADCDLICISETHLVGDQNR